MHSEDAEDEHRDRAKILDDADPRSDSNPDGLESDFEVPGIHVHQYVRCIDKSGRRTNRMENKPEDAENEQSDNSTISRRAFVAGGLTIGAGAAGAGYLYRDSSADPRDREDYAKSTVAELASEMPVERWELDDDGDTLLVWYQTTGSVSTDLERVGLAYADGVDDGLDVDLEATALGASNEFSFSIEQSLAEQYLEEEISEEEYINQIE